jgi:uncharacterized protein YdaU (DUF1376 family)
MNYYQHNIGDYRRDTAHLSLLEHGIYRQLLDWYYLDEIEITKETQTVFRRLSARTQDEQNAIEIILKEFFVETETGWKHKRCDIEIAAYHDKAQVNRVNGKLGGRPKKTQTVSDGLSDGNRNESEQNPNHKPLTINQEPITKVVKNITPLAMLVDMGIPASLAKDWLQVKKAKKSAVTQTGLDAIKKNAEANGYTFLQAITICTERTWVGFNADWLKATPSQKQFLTKAERIAENNDRAFAEFLNDTQEKTIEGEVIHD